jgi:MFS family permease
VNTAAAPFAPGGIYYGWWAIVPAAFIVILVTNGLTVGAIAAFDPALIAQLGVTRGAIKIGDAIQLGVTSTITVVAGAVTDRFGYRKVMLAGVASLLWGFYALGHVDSIQDYYWSRAWMGLGLAGAGMAMCMVAVSRWFVASRGLAIGIVLAGTSFGNGLMPSIFTALITAYGWRDASLFTLALLAVLPLLVWGLMREWPAAIGLKPLGAGSAAVETSAMGEDLDYWQILRRREFWLLGAAAFGTFYAFLGINNNLILHMMQLGMAQSAAAAMLLPLFLAGLSGKVLAGWLSDRFGRKTVWIACLALMLCGALLLTTLRTAWIAPAAIILGLGWGANYTLLQAVTGDVFGARSLGRVMGAITVLDAGGGALGPWITAELSDRSGNYQNGFLLVCGLVALAILSAASLRLRKI